MPAARPYRFGSSPRTARTVAVVAAVVTFTAAACSEGGEFTISVSTTAAEPTTTTVAERPDDGRLLIGAYLPQTGPGASLGEPMVAAIVEAVDGINRVGGVLGNRVQLQVLDEGAATGPGPLLADGVDAVIGPASSTNALAQLSSLVDPPSAVVTCSPTATAASLDDYPDSGFFFRTVPSDSLQMTAIARRAERTGVPSVAVGYLDDPYGRGLADALFAEIEQGTRQEVVAQIAFGADQEDLAPVVDRLLADGPGLVVVLGDADDGGRLLAALDAARVAETAQVIVNDSIRAAASIQQLSDEFRSVLSGVAPRAISDETPGAFTAHAVDCVNLIALAAARADSDAPSDIRLWMAPVSGGGRQCTTFEDCIELQSQGLQIDYNGLSGPLELSSSTGDPTRAEFVQFGFDADGDEIDPVVFEVP